LHVADIDATAARESSLKSAIETNDLTEFLDLADLADRDFTASHGASEVVVGAAIGSDKPPLPVDKMMLKIPRRPAWDRTTTPEQLDISEKESFLEWRRELAGIEEEYSTPLTPFEKNLQVWRQLWRVVERSDVLVQVVDGRDPLLYRSVDLENYVASWSHKRSIILLNKSDLLTDTCRRRWAEFFTAQGVEFIFFSAFEEQQKMDEKGDSDDDESVEDVPLGYGQSGGHGQGQGSEEEDMVRVYGVVGLLARLSARALECWNMAEKGMSGARPTIGFVGYPNVGKSSTLNVLCGQRRAAVGPTPGKTKHFQTINLENGCTVCDCPGLVFPSAMASKADMVCGGVLPIDQMRDHVPAAQLVADRVPRAVLEAVYGIVLPPPDPDYPRVLAAELLQAMAYVRGFMTRHGAPDEARAARFLLKDMTRGRLPFCKLPPDASAADQVAVAGEIAEVFAKVMKSKKMKNPEGAAGVAQAATAAKFLDTVRTTVELDEDGERAPVAAGGLAAARTKGGRKKLKGKMAQRIEHRSQADFRRAAFPLAPVKDV